MQKKYFNFQPKGMNTNMSPKFQSNEYATYMNNIRMTKDDNGILSLQFEKGNKLILSAEDSIKGTPIGVCVLNKYIVVFTIDTLNGRNFIYRLEQDGESFSVKEIFNGNLNFSTEHPLETLGVYENENIQKVYFIDGINQARVINILKDYSRYKNDSTLNYYNTALDFVPELQLNETVAIKKIIGTGEFPQGTIQYVFSYYDKYGRQSNLFAQSDLQYLSYASGVSPEDKVNCSFNINIYNVDKQFDYIRIYSIMRTSQDATPTVKRVIDLPISNAYRSDSSLSKVSALNTGSNLDDFGKTMNISNIAKFEQIDNYNNGLYVQGAACYDKYLFQAYIGGKFIDVINLETNQKQALLTINIDINTQAYHGNVLSFGKDIVPDSNFPYLYYSCEGNSSPQILVIKIISSNVNSNQWTGEVVQRIYLPECSDGSSQNKDTDISTTFKHYYQNGCVDIENDCIWVSGYTMESFNSNTGEYVDNKLAYRKYRLPKISEGNIYFSHKDVKDSFILPFKKSTQGMVIRNNKLYQCFGFESKVQDIFDEFLDCIDLSTKQILHSYQFPKTQLEGLGEELESPYIYKDNLYLSATVNNWRYYTLWDISFNSGSGGGVIVNPSEPPIPEGKADISFIDNGSIGDIIDPTELLYLGGNTICPNTFEQKDGTLFLGNYTTINNDISESQAEKIKEALHDKIEFKNSSRSLNSKGVSTYYNYEGQLEESDVAGFKFMEWYGVAIQFQNKNGRFSTPIYLGSVRNYIAPKINNQYLYRGDIELNTNLKEIIDTNIWVRARLLIVNPNNSLKTIMCQGIVSSTVFNYRDRYNNSPFVMSSWRMNPLGKHLSVLDSNSTPKGEIQNITFPYSPIISTESITETVVIRCGLATQTTQYHTVVTNKNNVILYQSYNRSIKDAKAGLKSWNNTINVDNLEWKVPATVTEQEITITNPGEDIIVEGGECFAYDESLVTFNSPDIEDQYNNITKNNKLRIVGVLSSTPLFSNYLIQGTDLNDPSKGALVNKDIKDFKSYLLWRDLDSSWDNLGNYDANKDWVFATYLWHRESSLSDNGIEKKDSNGNTKKVWSKLTKKIISNTRECTTKYLKDCMSYIDSLSEENKFNYYELPIDDIKVITTNKDTIYKLNSNIGNSAESLSYSADINKLFPSNNNYDIYGIQYYSYFDILKDDYLTYKAITVNDKSITSQDPIRIKYKETPHAIISFGLKDNNTIRLPKLGVNFKTEIDRLDSNSNRKPFWTDTLFTKSNIWDDYVTNHQSDMNPSDVKNNFIYYHASKANDFFYLTDLCVKDPDVSPYEAYNGSKDVISQYSFIPSGSTVKLSEGNVTLRGIRGDTYYQRWDCLKTFPYSTDDKNQYIDITSFFIESRINLDGRYDKQRGLKYNLGILNTNFNLINKSYTQRNNFFSYRQLEDDEVNNFTNQITISKTKVLGEDIDSWTNITLASVFDLDGDKGKLNAIRKLNNDLYCFQDSGVSRLLYNSRVQVNTSDGVPIEIANSAKLQDKQYLSDSIGCQNKWAIKSTPSGIYFVDIYNSELYKIDTNGISSISQNKFKNYFTKLNSNIWSPYLWANDIDAIKLEYDSTTYDLYITSKDTALAYNELLGEFTSFYDYGSTLYWVNLSNRSFQFCNSGLFEGHKGSYGVFNGLTKNNATIEFIVNGEFDSDKIFETVELTTSDTANINNWKANYYPFDTLEISNEYQEGKNVASATTVKKKFRTWRWQIPRNNNSRDRIRNMWAKIKLSKNYNSPLSIYDINVAYYN